MAADLVNSITSEKLTEVDWTKSIEICELVAHDERQAKDVIKAIKKRLGSKNLNTQIFTLTLLEMLMNNIGDHVHRQVIDTGLLPVLVKIVKKKSDSPVREKIFLLLDATQTSLGGNSGRFPQYYSAYYELVSAGVKFPQRANAILPNHQPNSVVNTNAPPAAEPPAPIRQRCPAEIEPTHTVPESSIIQKAASALEVLREVLDAVDSQHPEGAKEEFTLDLVEQCSFQKQRVMHLVLTSRDERVVSRAIDLNDQLEKVLDRHDQLISGRATSTSNHFVHNEVEEEEEEQLFRRMRKGKGHARAEDEDREKLMQRPITRESPSHQRPLVIGPPLKVSPPQPPQESIANGLGAGLGVSIPPPPAKHVEREKFFQENVNKSDGTGLATHVRGLSLHSRRSSGNSYSLSTDSD